jgi:hypothetical protein
MDQVSNFISDFRARRIRTRITWENLSATRDSFPGAGFSVLRTRPQWGMHQASAVWVGGGVLEPLAPSDFAGKSWEILELAAKSWEFWEFCIIRRHRS